MLRSQRKQAVGLYKYSCVCVWKCHSKFHQNPLITFKIDTKSMQTDTISLDNIRRTKTGRSFKLFNISTDGPFPSIKIVMFLSIEGSAQLIFFTQRRSEGKSVKYSVWTFVHDPIIIFLKRSEKGLQMMHACGQTSRNKSRKLIVKNMPLSPFVIFRTFSAINQIMISGQNNMYKGRPGRQTEHLG